jgi:hypothetical protein
MPNPVLSAGRAKTVSLVLKDKFGNDASVDGAPVWASTNPDIATVTPSADGLSCTLVSSGRMGTAEVTVDLDADLGEGVRSLMGSALVDVVSGEVSAVALLLSEDFDPEVPGDEPADEEPVDDDEDAPVEEDGDEPATPTPNP